VSLIEVSGKFTNKISDLLSLHSGMQRPPAPVANMGGGRRTVTPGAPLRSPTPQYHLSQHHEPAPREILPIDTAGCIERAVEKDSTKGTGTSDSGNGASRPPQVEDESSDEEDLKASDHNTHRPALADHKYRSAGKK
jgi:hypothetical protein